MNKKKLLNELWSLLRRKKALYGLKRNVEMIGAHHFLPGAMQDIKDELRHVNRRINEICLEVPGRARDILLWREEIDPYENHMWCHNSWWRDDVVRQKWLRFQSKRGRC